MTDQDTELDLSVEDFDVAVGATPFDPDHDADDPELHPVEADGLVHLIDVDTITGEEIEPC
jgi:hypothetical protein